MKKHRSTRPQPKPTTCARSGKKRWPDHESAVAVLHKASNSRHFAEIKGYVSPRSEVRAYRCDACNGWHTTSKVNWDSREIVAA
jgi:hypothetical protein